ncbi:class I tRNA ligase family protein [Candidatus Uhrbacteria bacterium]|nr:class I tRNA ligase family protein [Candidatus Uhrbacteria bacterium]
MKEEGKTRHDVGRDAFLKRVDQFAKESHDTIMHQVQKMGCSVDWSREAFTLDAARNGAVREAFKRLYDLGLVYRGDRVVNWDPIGQTVISDDELVYEEREATLYTFQYGPHIPIPISTTRPETKVGDTAIAVHPDGRWKEYIGKKYTAEFAGATLQLRVIGDKEIDDAFGTGALGVTPAHSMIDFDMARRHKLPHKHVINEAARMTDDAGDLVRGMAVLEAREAVVAWLLERHLLQKQETITQNISTAERTGAIVEPLPKRQWFVDVNKKFAFKQSKRAPIKGLKDGQNVTLKKLMHHVVQKGALQIIPERFEKTYFHWIDHLRDWCISRQLWYGHRVPAWYCVGCGTVRMDPKIASHWYFVRHGETDWNKERRIQGHQGTRLNGNGKEQAQKAAEQLKDKKIDLIVSSDLERARETAEVISRALGGVEVVYDAALRERHYGVIEGRTLEDLSDDEKKSIHSADGRPEGGESLLDVEERIHAALSRHKSTHQYKNVVIVSHGAALRSLMRRLKGSADPLANTSWPNAGIIPFSLAGDCPVCSLDFVEQDPDTLDTWFSSGLWTFSTLGWPDEHAKDFLKYHPTDLLETGRDILFFWVARMVLMSTCLLGEVPFHHVYLHGLVRDGQGRKMSKSLENIINPLDMIAKYGTDATRLSLVIGSTPGNDTNLSEERVAGFRNFTNKLWNIGRFVFMSVDRVAIVREAPKPKTAADAWILRRLNETVRTVTAQLCAPAYQLSQAGEVLRDFTWGDFADWYLEAAKVQQKDEVLRESTEQMLLFVLASVLRIWHPFMPFVTQRLWEEFKTDSLLMIEPWPMSERTKGGEAFEKARAIVSALRNVRALYRIAPSAHVSVMIATPRMRTLSPLKPLIESLARVTLTLKTKADKPADAVCVIVGDATIYVILGDLVDSAKERERLAHEIKEAESYIRGLDAKLSNEAFVNNAPAEIVAQEREKQAQARTRLDALIEQRNALSYVSTPKN